MIVLFQMNIETGTLHLSMGEGLVQSCRFIEVTINSYPSDKTRFLACDFVKCHFSEDPIEMAKRGVFSECRFEDCSFPEKIKSAT